MKIPKKMTVMSVTTGAAIASTVTMAASISTSVHMLTVARRTDVPWFVASPTLR